MLSSSPVVIWFLFDLHHCKYLFLTIFLFCPFNGKPEDVLYPKTIGQGCTFSSVWVNAVSFVNSWRRYYHQARAQSYARKENWDWNGMSQFLCRGAMEIWVLPLLLTHETCLVELFFHELHLSPSVWQSIVWNLLHCGHFVATSDASLERLVIILGCLLKSGQKLAFSHEKEYMKMFAVENHFLFVPKLDFTQL